VATFRQVINRVLRTIAEDEVASSESQLTDSYHQLIATFVNQIKEEIEDAHNWRSLRQNHTATVLANVGEGTIVGANDRSRVYRVQDAVNGQFVPVVFDITDPTNPIPLREISNAEQRFADIEDTDTVEEPSSFAITHDATGETLSILLYPTPNNQRTISVMMITPQARLEDNNLDTVIKIPARPLEMGAIWYALEERGEEMGTSALFTEERYRKAIDDAIARDAEEQGGFQLVVT
jgi:hypothetical protein